MSKKHNLDYKWHFVLNCLQYQVIKLHLLFDRNLIAKVINNFFLDIKMKLQYRRGKVYNFQ